MKCTDARSLMSSFLDGAMTGKAMRSVNDHLEGCATCCEEYFLLVESQKLVSSVGRITAPPDLALKLRVAISQQAARSRGRSWQGFVVKFDNIFNAFMVPATAGVVSAFIIFGLLIGVLMPGQLSALNDVPTALFTPPELASSPFGAAMGYLNTESLVVEAYVDANGRVQDYRILSAPEAARDVMPELKNMMIFTVFKPATTFGQPSSARVILSFAKVNVKG